jgi:hypothetical protein
MKNVFVVLVLLAAASGSAFAQEPGSKLYIPASAPNKTVDDGNKVVTTNGAAFNLVLQAELIKEKVPLTLVTEPAQADYVAQWAAIPEETTSHGNGSVLFHNHTKELYTVSTSLVGRDKQVVWAGSADKKNLHDCAAEITKQLKKAMKDKK